MQAKSCLLFVIFLLGSRFAMSQGSVIPNGTAMEYAAYYGPERKVVKLDPISRIPLSDIPIDRNFILRVYFSTSEAIPARASVQDPKISYNLGFYVIADAAYDPDDKVLAYFKRAIDIVMPPLIPNSNYELFFYRNISAAALENYIHYFIALYSNDVTEMQRFSDIIRTIGNPGRASPDQLRAYYDQRGLAEVIKDHGGTFEGAKDFLRREMEANRRVIMGDEAFTLFTDIEAAGALGTLQSKVEVSAKLNIVADGGLIYTGLQDGFNSVTPYVGINFCPRPMDSDLPFSYLRRHKLIKFHQRFTLNLGLTLNSLAKTGYRGNIFGSNNVMVGVGFKLSHALNVNGGALFYNNVEPNPLLDKKTLGIAPYTGLSINLKIRDALGDIAKVFSYGK